MRESREKNIKGRTQTRKDLRKDKKEGRKKEGIRQRQDRKE